MWRDSPHDRAAHSIPLRFVVHFTPTSSSWLNLVERWFAELTTKKLRRRAHRSVRQPNADIRAWITTWNDDPKPFVWTKTTDQILASIAATADESTNHETRT
jgi:transposase